MPEEDGRALMPRAARSPARAHLRPGQHSSAHGELDGLLARCSRARRRASLLGRCQRALAAPPPLARRREHAQPSQPIISQSARPRPAAKPRSHPLCLTGTRVRMEHVVQRRICFWPSLTFTHGHRRHLPIWHEPCNTISLPLAPVSTPQAHTSGGYVRPSSSSISPAHTLLHTRKHPSQQGWTCGKPPHPPSMLVRPLRARAIAVCDSRPWEDVIQAPADCSRARSRHTRLQCLRVPDHAGLRLFVALETHCVLLRWQGSPGVLHLGRLLLLDRLPSTPCSSARTERGRT